MARFVDIIVRVGRSGGRKDLRGWYLRAAVMILPARGAHIFVYGTLLAGEANHALLARARFVREGRTRPIFELRDLGAYPGLVRGGSQAVAGEVYEVDAVTLAALDRLEDHPRFYRRARIALEDGGRVEAYLLRRAQVRGRPVIEAGSWRARGQCEPEIPSASPSLWSVRP